MYNCKGITLSLDSTTVNGDHINEIHISVATSPPKSYDLSLKTIATQFIIYMLLFTV